MCRLESKKFSLYVNIKNIYFTEFDKELPPFDTYLNELFSVLGFLKMSPSATGQSTFKKLSSTCFVIFFLVLLSALWTAELISLKEIRDMTTLSEHLAVKKLLFKCFLF